MFDPITFESPESLVNVVSVSLGTVQNFETGKTKPQRDHLDAILNALDLDLEDSEVADLTRSQFTPDVRVFRDVMGVYLMSLPEDQRTAVIHDLTRQIFNSHQ